jgi:D-arabinose 1-dehydrogenase-like Zn-dependent alcohol dehydrogenase
MKENILGNSNCSDQIDEAFERVVKKDIRYRLVIDFACSKAA